MSKNLHELASQWIRGKCTEMQFGKLRKPQFTGTFERPIFGIVPERLPGSCEVVLRASRGDAFFSYPSPIGGFWDGRGARDGLAGQNESRTTHVRKCIRERSVLFMCAGP
jgi:hypothetical protein